MSLSAVPLCLPGHWARPLSRCQSNSFSCNVEKTSRLTYQAPLAGQRMFFSRMLRGDVSGRLPAVSHQPTALCTEMLPGMCPLHCIWVCRYCTIASAKKQDGMLFSFIAHKCPWLEHISQIFHNCRKRIDSRTKGKHRTLSDPVLSRICGHSWRQITYTSFPSSCCSRR